MNKTREQNFSSSVHARYNNRELSWLEFNQRVLNEALDTTVPLLERIKFFAITSSNLDEFLEVRVAGIKQQIESGVSVRSLGGLTPSQLLQAILKRMRRMVNQQYACWRNDLLPSLGKNGIRILEMKDLHKNDLKWVDNFYRSQVRPVLTPLAIDPSHPFPLVLNRSLNIITKLETKIQDSIQQRLAIIQVPTILPRIVKLPRVDLRQDYILLGDVIGHYLADLFTKARILGYWHFRVTRNSELYIDEEDVANLLKAVEDELHKRRKGDAVQLKVDKGCPKDIRAVLLDHLRLTEEDIQLINGPINPTRVLPICSGDHSPELRDPAFIAPNHPVLNECSDYFAAIRERDILLHHPYQSFKSVVDFLQQSARDPKVLAIKQTLYRSGGDPQIIGALMDAVKNGKQVTVVVELKARFDEANNIEWARRLEEAGVHVVYGLVGYKIHAKVTLVVRQDEDGIRRYLHLSTGNYNPNTAKIYTDLGLLTCRPAFGEDATNLFNLLTGISQFQPMEKFLVSPFDLHARMIEMIGREGDFARKGVPSRIIAKMNALVDKETIDALYEASQAGVKIDLIIRGICCLKPGVPGLSDNIQVRSIVDRFLEHSRLVYFENGCQPEIYMSSADWMPRNFYRRIEVAFPIEDGNLREYILNDVLLLQLRDNQKAYILNADGTYSRTEIIPGESICRSQVESVKTALTRAIETVDSPTRQRKYPRVKVRTKVP